MSVALRPTDVSPFDVVSHCINDISHWFLENGMKQFCSELVHSGQNLTRLLGSVLLQSKLLPVLHLSCSAIHSTKISLDCHVTDIVPGCSYHRRALGHIWLLINLSAASMVAQGV